jgi:hypothetical protein
MVTGIEVAGLALAIFPIVLKGLRFYLEDTQEIKEARAYTGKLKRLHRKLKMENMKFENTCELLLEGMVSAEEMKRMVSGSGWEDPGFQEVLKQRLRPQDIQTIVDVMGDLKAYLQELVDAIGIDSMKLDENNKVRISSDTRPHTSEAFVNPFYNVSSLPGLTCNGIN